MRRIAATFLAIITAMVDVPAAVAQDEPSPPDPIAAAAEGADTVGVVRGNTLLLRASNRAGPADVTVAFGRPGDLVLTGDWNGDGIDTPGVRRGNVFYLRNSLTSGRAQITFAYGRADDTPVVGDWNGDGIDTIGVRRGNVFYLRNSLTSGRANRSFAYGLATDTPVVGDWNGDGIDTIGVRRGNVFHLRNSLTSGRADRSFTYGRATDTPVAGAWGIATGAPGPPELQVRTVVSGLTIPWGIGFTPDGTMLFTERHGVLRARRPDGRVRTVAVDLGDLFASGETGLMGIVVDPGFASNRRFYTCQGHAGPQVQVIAWTMNATFSAATRVADPLVGGIPATTGRHGGCRLRFGPDGYLWIATGDAAIGSAPQSLTSLGGKVLRVDPATGAGVASNPFAGSANANTRRIYTYGHRNVQGLARRPGTSQMWSVEHGPSVNDEINRLVAGGNYGWDPVPGYNEAVPMTDRVKHPDAVRAKWSSGAPTLATSGAIFLEGDQWGSWEGRLAVATLKDSTLRVFAFTSRGRFVDQVVVPELDGTFGRLRTPMLGPDGALYVSTANGGGTDRILRIVAS